MFPSPPPHPGPDAAVYRFGMRRLRTGLPGTLIALLLAPLPLVVTAGKGGAGAGQWIFAGVWLLLWGGLGALMTYALWAGRGTLLAFDAYGVWWQHSQERQTVVPWQSLAGVGLYWAHKGNAKAGQKVMSLELCPYGDVDASDPLLKPLVVRDEPLRPGLPDRRYRIRIPMYASRQWGRELAQAAYERAPQLWFGEHERPYGSMRPLQRTS
ncbi:hypothetical protein [Streptomyces sp. NBC_00996]|uniref:hypothetical protein n=1 Tax=Streptomyces sp. NBC_00996 TaxID=2903710 RepID=UPI00386962BA|nr:hypothetical protein OG390_23040 [Streptomyces sp. NBC_00996]